MCSGAGSPRRSRTTGSSPRSRSRSSCTRSFAGCPGPSGAPSPPSTTTWRRTCPGSGPRRSRPAPAPSPSSARSRSSSPASAGWRRCGRRSAYIWLLDQHPGNWIIRRLVDLGMLAGLGLLLALSLAITTAINKLLDWLAGPDTTIVGDTILRSSGPVLEFAVNLILAAALIAAVPRLRLSPRRLIPAALTGRRRYPTAQRPGPAAHRPHREQPGIPGRSRLRGTPRLPVPVQPTDLVRRGDRRHGKSWHYGRSCCWPASGGGAGGGEGAPPAGRRAGAYCRRAARKPTLQPAMMSAVSAMTAT